MTFFVKVTRLDSTDYAIKNTVNAEMTHHNYITKLYVIISYFLCCKRQTKDRKQYTLLIVLLRCIEIMQEINPGQSVVVKIL